MFSSGQAAFLKTSNFALDTVDIPHVEADPMPPSRITLQQLVPPTGYAQLPDLDTHFAV
ncbi:hypothetical protein FIBSPDRAFT_969016 [Athelia psychrophila]|uniref:Uncharacterized protein n=1 Tax=Athelia psychrophila TaxID=1759441 RepID=A0A167TYN3_9AGAM|nr:hypothetical protein FIBSPDRAFT_969016 [Fibularhizoctonia sp. CBS 109695]